MVNVNVHGRMVVDAELKTTQNGKQFITSRFAVDDFNNNEKTTAWFRLTIEANERNMKLLPFLTKGKLLSVIGTEFVSAYLDKEGKPQVSRDIRVFNIDFINSGTSGETTSQTAIATPQTETTEVPMSCGTFSKPQVSVASTSDVDDDLPF